MASRWTARTAFPLAIAASFAAGVLVDRFLLRTRTSGPGATAERDEAAPATSPSGGTSDRATLAGRERNESSATPVSSDDPSSPRASSPRGTKFQRALAAFDDALARGATAEARAALDAALAANEDWGKTRDRAMLLPLADLESWVLDHVEVIGISSAAMLLLERGAVEAGVSLVERIVAAGDFPGSSLATAALRLGGERALVCLEGYASLVDPAVGLAVAEWLATHERKEEAVRRVVSGLARRTPTTAEIAWLEEMDPHAAVSAARSLVERLGSPPQALRALAHALETAGDGAGAFDAYAAALRAGLDPSEATAELARIDPGRAATLLLERYGGAYADDTTSEALVSALLRTGRVADAGRELLRWALAGDDGRLEQAARIDPVATVAALAPRFTDLEAVPGTEAYALMAYGVALRLAGQRDDAMRVLRTAAERLGRYPGNTLVELMRCDPTSARSFVEERMPSEVEAPDLRLRLLGMLGRATEAGALFDRLAREGRAGADVWSALATSDPERAVAGLRRIVEEEEGVGNQPDDQRIALALALVELGRTAEARAALARVSTERSQELGVLLDRAALR